MGLTTDRNDPGLKEIRSDGQQVVYLVLTEEERAKGFVRPVRQSYIHKLCGQKTTVGLAIAETYARNPKYYSGTFCCSCGKHFDLGPPWEANFIWYPDGEPVGSAAEDIVWLKQQKEEDEIQKGMGTGI